MAQLNEAAAEHLDSAQAADLGRIIELEARWENLRYVTPTPTPRDLRHRQRAYEAYQTRLAAFTAQHQTLRVPELTPSGPERLVAWCRTVRAVLGRSGTDGGCPIHTVEKAYRLAGLVADRLGLVPVPPSAPSDHADALRMLDDLTRWCCTPAVEVGK